MYIHKNMSADFFLLDYSLTPEEKGKLMRPSNKENPKLAYKCKLCDLVLTRYDRVKYHIVCHHWGLRPYMCPVCDMYKVRTYTSTCTLNE